VADLNPSWWPAGLNRWGLDSRNPLLPQVVSSLAQLAFILGGPIILLVMIEVWPPLVSDQTVYATGLGAMLAFFLLSFAVVPGRSLPPKLPRIMRIMYRLGLALAATGWLLGVGGIVNGCGTPVAQRDVPVVAKHETLQRDPGRRTLYVSLRPWPGSREVLDWGARRRVYDALEVPITGIHTPRSQLEAMPQSATARLVIGHGRLGLEWIKAVRTTSPAEP